MIGVVVVSHAKIAKELLEVVQHIVGPQEKIIAISIYPEDDMKKKRQEIIDAVKNVDSGKGVVVLTDMFGGTPSNLAISVMEKEKVEVVAGVNLPMLIKLASVRHENNIEKAVASAQESGRKYINVASKLLESENT